MDSLIDKVVDGALTRADLRAAAQIKRAAGDTGAQTRHDRLNPEDKELNLTPQVAASDIIIALRKHSDWLQVVRTDKYFDHKYHVFTEFRADTGTSSHTRLMDALIVETLTASSKDFVALRGIEIKVNKSDLKKILKCKNTQPSAITST